MKKGIFYVFVCVMVLFGATNNAQAYLTKGQTANLLPDKQGVLYTVTYDFGSASYDLYLPVVPERKSDNNDQARTLTYSLNDDRDGETNYGVTTGVVLANAEIQNGQYFIPKGEARRLTLVVLMAMDEVLPVRSLDLAMQVTNLPFMMINGAVQVKAQLNPSELKYYVTPEIDIPSAGF
ncbi:MAG: hypothetical protein R3B53_01420 [Candidatus Paceibacterota bacterium]